tara:strand:- start:1291 stop:1449 length:159 start_codon:yes stop_codon:yes gene_type:complete
MNNVINLIVTIALAIVTTALYNTDNANEFVVFALGLSTAIQAFVTLTEEKLK